MRYDFTDLSRLPLPHADLADTMALAWEVAGDPRFDISDCPYGRSRHARVRYLRIAWRTVFRRARQRKAFLAATVNSALGLKIAA